MDETVQMNDALASNYLLVDVSFKSWGGERINRGVSDEVIAAKQASKDAGKFTMKLLASADAELKTVQATIVAMRSFVNSRTLPWALAADRQKGARLIATSQSLQFLADLNHMKKHFDQAVADLQKVWPARVQSALVNLGAMADPGLYPDVSDLPKMFRVVVELRPVPAVSDLARLTVPATLAEALGSRLAAQTQAQIDNAMLDLRDRFATEIKRMATQLGKVSAGEKTRLYESMITNVQELCGLAKSMNLTGSERFNDTIERIERDLLRYPIDTLREDTGAAKLVATQATSVLETLESESWY